MKSESWVGLESNPAVMTQYAVKLGVSERWAFSDCWGLDRDALKHVPAPCVGCIFLYPFSQVEARKRTLGARRGCAAAGRAAQRHQFLGRGRGVSWLFATPYYC